MYNIKVDNVHRLIEVTLGGMMEPAEVDRYIADLKRAIITHALRSFAMVIDVRACPIQSQDMVISMGKHMLTMPKARALAIVVGSSLARMQVRRLFTQSYARTVLELEDGQAWAISGTEPPATLSAHAAAG